MFLFSFNWIYASIKLRSTEHDWTLVKLLFFCNARFNIAVGKRSSALKLKPTPPCEITSSKRPRIAPRASTSKRKVLMDDSMVLHGEYVSCD